MQALPPAESPFPCELWRVLLCLAALSVLRAGALVSPAVTLRWEEPRLYCRAFSWLLIAHALLAGANGPALVWGVLRARPLWVRSALYVHLLEVPFFLAEFVLHALNFPAVPVAIHGSFLFLIVGLQVFIAIIINLYWKLLLRVIESLER